MAEAFDVRQLQSFLECSICLEQFDNPKMLKCGHVFCKTCLEDIMKFEGDASVVIMCPLRCADQNIIANDQTVNDLATSYNFKNILGALKTEEGKLSPHIPLCHYDESCKKEISVYCCEMLLCNPCYVKHAESYAHNQNKPKINLSFSKREDKFVILCEEHASKCTHLCVDNQFLCKYCLHRHEYHKRHSKNTIEADAALLKQALLNDSKKTKTFGNICEFLNITEQNIETGKEKFDELLQQRKEKCLGHYNDFLNEEEERLKRKLHNICNNHQRRYPRNVNPVYYEEKLQKSDVELAIEKEEILDTICQSDLQKTLICETISVSSDVDFHSEHPLGDIEVAVEEKVSINSPPIATLRHNINLDSRKVERKEENEEEMKNVLSKLVEGYEKRLNFLTEENEMLKVKVQGRRENENENNYKGKLNVISEENRILKAEVDRKSKHKSRILKNPANEKVQVFFDIVISKNRFFRNTRAGRIVMNLFRDTVPKTCENFVQLCTHREGFGYKGSKFHLVSSSYGYCAGGDITKGNGSGGKSIFGDKFECENFFETHDDKGIVTMYNHNGFISSIFCITTKPLPNWDGIDVVFGKVTDDTYNVIAKIMDVEVQGTKPCQDILIENCGLL